MLGICSVETFSSFGWCWVLTGSLVGGSERGGIIEGLDRWEGCYFDLLLNFNQGWMPVGRVG